MRKLIVPALVAALALSGCNRTPNYGAGEVSAKTVEPAEYMTTRECTRLYSKAYCATPRLKEEAEYEITFVDKDSKREVEVEVNYFVYESCRVGHYFDGETCYEVLTPSPSAS